jgi:HAE1 family hydrophobic/amphiphilic exporter-1
MKIANISIKRPVTVIMVMLMVILLGTVSLTRLGIDLYPKINVPVAIVNTTYQGVGPNEIETLVTRPIEGVLATVSGVTDLSSMSSEGSSLVIMQFDFSQDMDQAALEIREKVDMVKGFLPDDSTDPQVFKIDPNAMPIITLSVSSPDGLKKAQTIVEDKIVSRIERIEGVAQVSITGQNKSQVTVLVDPKKLSDYSLTYNQLKGILMSENLNLPAGKIDQGSKSLALRILGEYDSVEDVANIPIPLQSGEVIRIKDIASVNKENTENYQLIRLNDEESIGINILKTTDSNTVKVAKAVNEELDKLRSELEGTKIDVISDSSVFISTAISNVAQSGIVGGLLAVLILYLFLRNLRTTMIIAISIPISIIGTFTLIYFSGITINLMTLGGLALGIGMLVDNSIVVLENIYRFRDMGYSKEEAAYKGTSEVGMAITASTLTTVAVFLPVVFVEGITSMLFKELALTITFSLLSSLVAAVTVVPMLASKIISIDHKVDQKVRFSLFDKGFDKLRLGYDKLVKLAVKHKGYTIIASLGLFIITLLLAFSLGAEFIPSMDEGMISINIETPQNTKFEKTLEITDEVENKISQIAEVDRIYTSIGVTSMNFLSSSSQNISSITVTLKDTSIRERTSFDVADEIRNLLKDTLDAKIEVTATQSQGFSGMSAPISIILKGDDLDILKEYSDIMTTKVSEIEGTREVSSSFEEGQDEFVLIIDRKKSAYYGLNSSSITQYVKDVVSGTTLGTYKSEGQEYNIVIKGPNDYKSTVNNLENLMIDSAYGKVPLYELIESINMEKAPKTISRDDQVRTVTISSSIYGRDLQSVSNDIKTSLDSIILPQGYSYEITGQSQELIEAFSSLALAFILAVLLIYMIMASQFENLLYPFIIMFTIPLAFSGSILGLFIMQKPISVPAVIGLIMLAGIVVNNAIVLIDYINTLRNTGMKIEEAVIEAAHTRLRPILMTTLTTILGLLPMSLGIGDGSETTAPLAIVVIGGLALSTLLTLVLIPALYIVFNIKKVKQERINDGI